MSKRTVLKVAGQSGMGLLSVGRIVSKTLKHMGYYVHSDREYPSVIKGGHSNLQIDFGTEKINSLSNQVDLVVALDRYGLEEYMGVVKPGGVLVHGYERYDKIRGLADKLKEVEARMLYLPSRTMAHELGGNELMVNMILLGLMWRVLGFDLAPLEDSITEQFKTKPKLLEIDLKCVRAGYEGKGIENIPQYKIDPPNPKKDNILVDGNLAIALGAIHAGVRAYYAYPMSPSSSILMHMANFAKETGVLVKQAEDEITACQMAVGSMHMGARTLVGTSGGGFDLMTETFSLAGMIETPLVAIICQRPGPATGMPTWTTQGDLAMAIHAGHGEYARMVIAASDAQSCYDLIQQALNYAEEFQVPVVFLTEKVICESQTMVPHFDQKAIPIKRGLVTDAAELEALKPTDRYKITESGVSKRWLPGRAKAGYYANSDEHKEDGRLTEEAEPCAAMIDKRLRKMKTIQDALPEPTLYGAESGAQMAIVGWGSTKATVLDAMKRLEEQGVKISYLHYEYLWPLKTGALEKLFADNQNVHILEGNYTGQLANIIREKTGLQFKGKFLKYDGRPFFVEEVVDYVMENSK